MDNARVQAMLVGWQRTIDTVHQGLSPSSSAGGGTQQQPGFWDGVKNGAENVAAGAVNGAASLGNAFITDPIARAELIGDGVAGLAMEAVGGGLDATGIGAIAGVPLNVAGAAVLADGTRRLLTDALQNPVQPMQVNAKSWGERYDEQKKANEEQFDKNADPTDGTWTTDDLKKYKEMYGEYPAKKVPKLEKRWGF